MKKYRIIDADGSEYQVEEEELVEKDAIPELEFEKLPEAEEEKKVSDEALSDDEIAALKRLAAMADKLIALAQTEDEEPKEMKEEEEVIDADEDEDEEIIEEEEVIDTDCEEMSKPRDSKQSMGAIERKSTSVDDSLVDDVADAWAKRYYGGNK